MVVEAGQALSDAVEAAVPGWVVRSVERLLVAWSAGADPEVMDWAVQAGGRAAREVGGHLRLLMAQDLDAQPTTPLAIVRHAIAYPSEVLRRAGVPAVERDDFAQRRFPGDDYDLTPATWADVDPALADLGLAWGAAKALAHRRRHGAPEG